MGIKKSINYKKFNPEYMAITGISFDEAVSYKVRVTLSLYKDREAKQEAIARNRIITDVVEIPISELESLITEVKNKCYPKIEETEKYSDALPVLEDGQEVAIIGQPEPEAV